MNLQSQLSVLLLVLSKDDCKISVSFKLIQSFKLGNGKQLKKSQYCSYLVATVMLSPIK